MPVQALDQTPDPDPDAVVPPAVVQRVRSQSGGAAEDARGQSVHQIVLDVPSLGSTSSRHAESSAAAPVPTADPGEPGSTRTTVSAPAARATGSPSAPAPDGVSWLPGSATRPDLELDPCVGTRAGRDLQDVLAGVRSAKWLSNTGWRSHLTDVGHQSRDLHRARCHRPCRAPAPECRSTPRSGRRWTARQHRREPARSCRGNQRNPRFQGVGRHQREAFGRLGRPDRSHVAL